jgi:ribosomal protein S18 acetylase RimI-like enzyme
VIIAERDGTILRQAQGEDMPRIDDITITCYSAIWESYVNMLGEECYQAVRRDPHLTWEERKIGQVHHLFKDHPDWVWVLEQDGDIIGFVTFMLFPDQKYGHIDNNGVAAQHIGEGWGKFMYQHVLQYFRQQGLKFAHVDTGVDDAHIPARRTYESVGFDRKVPSVEYWQDLRRNNPGSVPE